MLGPPLPTAGQLLGFPGLPVDLATAAPPPYPGAETPGDP